MTLWVSQHKGFVREPSCLNCSYTYTDPELHPSPRGATLAPSKYKDTELMSLAISRKDEADNSQDKRLELR
jgi:hypothetical protein